MEISENLKKAINDYLNGDPAAFSVIYNESNKYIYVCINNVMTGNDNKEEMIQDIMQDTYLEISKHLNSLDNVNRFLSWAGTIATRKCYEAIKKSEKYVMLNEDESFDNLSDDDNIIPEEIMQNREKQRLLREIIQNELTEMQKLCIVGYFYNEMKQSEIAKELSIPENSVKSHLLRAKAKIKEAVLDLEKNKGTKMYAVAPLLLLLFKDEVKACTVSPKIGEAVMGSVGVSRTAVQAAGTVVKTTAGALKVKIIAIAAAVLVTAGGVTGGIAIANHNRTADNEPTEAAGLVLETESTTEKVTTRETVTENETESESTSTWNSITLAKIGEEYEVPVLAEFISGEREGDLGCLAVNTMVESIMVSGQKIIIKEADYIELDSNKNTDFSLFNMYTDCELINKETGESFGPLDYSETEQAFIYDWSDNENLIDDINDWLVYITHYNNWTWHETFPGLLFEIPVEQSDSEEELDDGLKSTLVPAAKRVFSNYDNLPYAMVVAFCDYTLDGVPEFFILDATSFGNLEGQMFKYENGEYVYYMDIYSFADGSSRLYKDETTGGGVVLEIDYSFFTDESGECFSSNTFFVVDVDSKSRTVLTQVYGDDMLSINERTYYTEDGKELSAEEFLGGIYAEMESKYTFVSDGKYVCGPASVYDAELSELNEAYVFYLKEL